MTTMPELGRQSAHVLLDGLVAWEEGAPEAKNAAALELAMARLHDIGAVPVILHDDGDEPEAEVNISNLVFPALISMRWLVGRVSELSGQSTENVVRDLRDFIDDES